MLSRREQAVVGIGVLVALAVGVPGLLLDSGGRRQTSLAEATRRSDLVKARAAAARAEIDRLDALVRRRVYPGEPRALVNRMVAAAQRAGVAAGVRPNDLKPMPVENVSGLRRVPVRVSLSGSFAATARYLYELEQGGSRFHVDQLQMSSSDLQSDRLEVDLRMVGYVAGDEGPTPGSAGGASSSATEDERGIQDAGG